MLMLFVITQMDHSCAPANLDTLETDEIVQVHSIMLQTLRFCMISYTRTSFYLLQKKLFLVKKLIYIGKIYFNLCEGKS